jgi:hypothetical protein
MSKNNFENLLIITVLGATGDIHPTTPKQEGFLTNCHGNESRSTFQLDN